jgi:ABC-2 type transport system ATP-binding protein
MRGLLRALAAEGRAVLVSSHLMNELQDIADHLVVIGRGRLVADAPVEDLLAAASEDRVSIRTGNVDSAIAALTDAGATASRTGPGALSVTGLPAERVVAVLTGGGIAFSEVAAHRASLEEAYLRLTRDAVEFRADTVDPADRAGGAAR